MVVLPGRWDTRGRTSSVDDGHAGVVEELLAPVGAEAVNLDVLGVGRGLLASSLRLAHRW